MENHKTKLENDRLVVEIEARGAELVRIYDKKKEREVLWDAKPEIWKRHAPILFPFIGNCFEGKYRYEGTVRPMSSHGFARDSKFERTAKKEQEVWYQLADTPESYRIYPFHFKLNAGHRLEGNKITVLWKVENTDEKELLFMIGGHPAFNTPAGFTVHDFTFEFDRREMLHYEAPDENGYADASKQGILELKDGRAALKKGFFSEVLTYIFDGGQVGRASILLPGGEPYVTLHCQGFPYLGVWTQEETHPFVCLEPWFGRCADRGFTGELKERAGIVSLEVGAVFEAEYSIEIH